MMKTITLLIPLSGLILFGCEQDSSGDNIGIDNEKIEVVTHDIDATNANGFYYDLVNATEADSSDTLASFFPDASGLFRKRDPYDA